MVQLPPNELARRLQDGLAIATAPSRLMWQWTDLSAADGHQLRANFHASLRAVDDSTERKMLQEVLLQDRPSLYVHEVEAHYRNSLHDAAASAAKEQPAEYWLTEAGRAALCERLRTTAAAVSFACGLEVLPPVRLELESPTLAQQQLEAMHRKLAEQQAAGRIEHFQRAVDLLKHVESQGGAIAPAAASKAIESMNPADRGAMLKTLLLAGSEKNVSTALCAVAGVSLLRVDLASDAPPTVRNLPSTLGPLRSLQRELIDDRPTWVIGARDGVLTAVDAGDAAVMCYRDGGVETTQGFSRVIFRAGQLIACHSEAGIIAWNVRSAERPAKAWRPGELGGSPRNLQPLDASSLLFSVSGRLMTLSETGSLATLVTSASSNIVAIVPDDHRLLVIHEDGTFRAIERLTRAIITLEHRGQRISTAAGLPWLGGQRLLLAGDDGSIDCVGTEDDLLTQYVSGHRGARRVVASTSHVAALAGDRTRVIVWNAWDGKTPVREISLARATQHRAADLILV